MFYNENNQPTTIKDAAIKFDVFIRDGGVGSSMFFVLIMLIIVNTHSLHFLFGDGVLNWVFAIFSAIGFSIATTSVIRKPVAAWMKYLFPLFDVFLVFLGFNLLNESIPVHFIMTLLFSAFTGAILIGLGTINYTENFKSEEEKDMLSELASQQSVIDRLQSEKETDKARLNSAKARLTEVETEMNKYKKIYLLAEKSRILKKKPENRTESELRILQELETSNQQPA